MYSSSKEYNGILEEKYKVETSFFKGEYLGKNYIMQKNLI